MSENGPMLSKVATGLEFMIGRAQVENPSARRTDGAYQAARAVREAARVLLPTGHPALKQLDQMVRTLASGKRPSLDAQNEDRRRARGPRKPRLPSPRKQRALLPVTNSDYAETLRSGPACLYAELVPNEHPESEFVTKLVHAAAQEIMMSTSLWPHEVARLQIRHIRYDGDRIWIETPGDHGIAPEFACVGHPRHVIQTYIERVRPLRPGRDSEFLFPGKAGRGHHPNALSQAVRRLIGECTGHPLSAKDLRAAMCIMHGLGSDASDAAIQRFLVRKRTDNDPILNLIAAWRRNRD